MSLALIYGDKLVLRPLPYPALERIRRLLLDRASKDPRKFPAYQVLIRLIFSTEIKAVIGSIVGHRPDLEKRAIGQSRFVDIDQALVPVRVDITPALQELTTINLPRSHRDLLEKYATSDSHKHRVSALCAMVYLGAVLNRETS